jgi:hypothetical protein
MVFERQAGKYDVFFPDIYIEKEQIAVQKVTMPRENLRDILLG